MVSRWQSVEDVALTLCVFWAVNAVRLALRIVFHIIQFVKAEKELILVTGLHIWQLWTWPATRLLLWNCVRGLVWNAFEIVVFIVRGCRIFAATQAQVLMWYLFPAPGAEGSPEDGDLVPYLLTRLRFDLSLVWQALCAL